MNDHLKEWAEERAIKQTKLPKKTWIKQPDGTSRALVELVRDKDGCVVRIEPAPVQEPRARLMTYIGKGPYPKPGYTVARTYEECPENQYPDAWEEGEKLYTTPPAAQPAVPEGWKLVPVEPTEIMQDAGVEVMPTVDCHPYDAGMVYKAMLDAAPEKGKP